MSVHSVLLISIQLCALLAAIQFFDQSLLDDELPLVGFHYHINVKVAY